ncbi:MAG: M56 family metallopeptidase [Anaerovoracaceae bacterium]
MSLIGSYVIIFVLIARLLLKKAPKIFSYALWSTVLFRLLCPFSFESVLSLMPMAKTPMSQDIIYSTLPQINTGINIIDNSINPILPAPNMGDSVNPLQVWIFIGTITWVLGMFAMLIYSVISFAKLKKSLIGSVQMKDNIYLADHITRILSFVALSIHWFNPLVWASFILSGKDMELSCDEAVMKKMNVDIRAEYSQSLLRFGTAKRMIHATPLAFGEGDTKSRIKNVLNYKKPSFWVIVVSVIAIVAIGVGLAANPKEELVGKPYGFAGVNAIILKIDKANLSMTVKGIDLNSAIGDKCIVDLKEASLISVAINSEPKSLSLDAFAVGDTVVLFVDEIQETYPTRAKATTVQIQESSTPLTNKKLDYFIMTDEIGAIGCEYSVNKDNQLDTLQMLSALEKLNGFKFDTDWASHGYIKFAFNDKTPKDIFLRYCANVDEIWQQEYITFLPISHGKTAKQKPHISALQLLKSGKKAQPDLRKS